jgi:hypothetical protein
VDDDDDIDTALGKRSDDDKPSWVLGTISKPLPQHMGKSHQKQIKLDECTQPGWGDTAHYFCERDIKFWTTESKVPIVVNSIMDKVEAAPAAKRIGELMESHQIVPGKSQMSPATCQTWK